MNAADHQAEAERLINQAHAQQEMNGPGCGSEELLAEAQVHATLALVDTIRRAGVWAEDTADQLDAIPRRGEIELMIADAVGQTGPPPATDPPSPGSVVIPTGTGWPG